MPDDVWPISDRNPGPGSLYSYGGIGFEFKGFTRTDADGYCFATRWFQLCGLPILPLERFYLRELGPGPSDFNRTTTRYDIAGRALIRPGEALRTYLFGWLMPLAGIVPLIVLFGYADVLTPWIPIAALILWPAALIVGSLWLLNRHRARWAPLREPHWREPAR